ncbi:hypothetical protein [Streptomyces alboflavus]|uniref:hypothetical protein n=1 Tax=Streptomyces alboflavus TaxID=67267 RepID=UPI0004BE6B22|nr:hypothetical protein [Streptomyces alboflavus]
MTTTFAEPWPDGVIARYLTVAGATVDLTRRGEHADYRCTGCGYAGHRWVERVAREHAQGHAEKCRALPRP